MISRITFTLFLFPIIALGGFVLYLGLNKALVPLDRYIETPGEIYSSEIQVKRDGGSKATHTTTRLIIRYFYMDKAGALRSGVYNERNWFFTKKLYARQDAHPVNTKAPIYYDPENPDRSVLFLEKDWRLILLLNATGLVMIIITALTIIESWKKFRA